jgi:hypothetical protein
MSSVEKIKKDAARNQSLQRRILMKVAMGLVKYWLQ